MLYREFGKTGEKLSILGFGAMRLPLIDNQVNQIDETLAIDMVRTSIDKGVNYLDTAWPYHGGVSEAFCAKVMADGYRDKVKIATKLPTWEIKKPEDMNSIFQEQLKRLQVNKIDFYLLHTLTKGLWKTMKDMDYSRFLDDLKSDGSIGYAGFSFHDDLALFKEIVDAYDWDFCQIQLNYLDENYQAGLEGMRYAAEKGLGVIIMEPLRGGMLAKTESPADIEKLWNSAAVKRSPAEWALRYVWDFPETGVVLSGMSTMDQTLENIKIAGEALPQSLTAEEQNIIQKVKAQLLDKIEVNCTNCGYCMPCPAGVEIPGIFWLYNHASLFDDPGKARFMLNQSYNEEQKPSACVGCGQCESHCPQSIPIIKELKIIRGLYQDK